MNIAIPIIVTILLVLGNSYFSAAELAMVSAKRMRLEQAAEDGDARAAKALEVSADSDGLFATIQVYITIMSLFASAAAATTLSEPFGLWISSTFGLDEGISLPLATVLITLVVSYFTIVVGEVFPKRLGWAYPEEVSMALASSLKFFQTIATPLVRLTAASSDALARLFHVRAPEDHEVVSEEELKVLVAENDELLPDEKRMVTEILDMSETTVAEIMTPRTDIIFVEDNESVKATLERMRGTGYSRLPVFHESHDRIVGVVHYKDLLPALLDDREDDPVGELAKEVLFVPETKDIFPLLSQMQAERMQMAIVVDEYGGCDGLVSIEDIVEEIVGEIVDESDLESKYLTQLSDDEWLAQGGLPVDDAIDLGWPLVEAEDYDTIAGWFLDEVDSIPDVGDSIEREGWRFTVQTMRRHRISTMRVQRLADADAPADGEPADA